MATRVFAEDGTIVGHWLLGAGARPVAEEFQVTAGSVVAVVTTAHDDVMTKYLSLEVRGVDGMRTRMKGGTK